MTPTGSAAGQIERAKAFCREQRGKPYVWGESSLTPEQIQAWLEWVSDPAQVAAWCEEHGVTVEPMPPIEEILAQMDRDRP